MKKLFTILLVSASVGAHAQAWVDDSVSTGPNYPNRVFYSLQNGIVGTMPFNDKDLMVDVSIPYSASVRINGGFNAALYAYTAGDTTDWATLDTAGLAAGTGFTRLWDAQDAYAPSAFEGLATGHPNYGWGNYNSVTHDVNGNALFVYKTVGGVWKKVWIKKLSATTLAYTILVDNIGGGAEETITISKQGVTDKSFIYYSFANDSTYDLEPAIGTYDLIFTKHVGDYIMPPNIVPNQAVTGVEINHNVMVAKADHVVPDDVDHTSYTLGDNLQEIGATWKYLNASFQWVVEDSLSYFVQDVNGSIWQIRFTGFVGSSAGKYKFQKRQMVFASVEDENNVIANFQVFPNPTTDFINVAYTIDQQFDAATLSIIDLSGKLITTRQLGNATGFNQTQVDIASLNIPAGIYVARVQVGNYAGVQKFIVR